MNDEVAGHLIRQIPETHIALEKALQAVALAANRIDYDELKQELQPHRWRSESVLSRKYAFVM